MRLRFNVMSLTAAFSLLVPPVCAQVQSGHDYQINSLTSGDQVEPAVGVDDSGKFLVVWSSDTSAGTDIDFSSIQGRWFTPDGAKSDLSHFFKGEIDDVALWGRALNADEVSQIWNGGAGASILSLISD